eukprot:SAG31_NODE_175_length_21352_cov_3.981508_20_plen_261_part_00
MRRRQCPQSSLTELSGHRFQFQTGTTCSMGLCASLVTIRVRPYTLSLTHSLTRSLTHSHSGSMLDLAVWSHGDVPSSSVAHVSRDGTNWTYTATIASAKNFPWSGEGANEGGAGLASDEKTIVVVMRMGAGDYTPASSCLGFFDYHLSRSTGVFVPRSEIAFIKSIAHIADMASDLSDGGMSWSFPRPIAGAGAAMPNVQRVGKSLLLSGGRMCGNATSDIFLWLNRDGMGGLNDFEPFSLSYWHNTLLSNATCNVTNSK